MTTVLLVRHGRTSANATGVLAGRTPGVELDEVGQGQAEEAGRRIGPLPLRALVSSPLERCRQTAAALAAARADGLEVSVEDGLVECGYGDWTGRALKDLSKDKLWTQVQQQPSAVRFPGGESMTEMSSRAIGSIRSWDQRLGAEHGEQAIWVAVSHGDVIKAILADALGMHLDSFQRILVDPASVSIVRYTSVRPYVIKVNSTSSDLASLLPPPGRKQRSRRKPPEAPVGGGLGAAEAVD
ncbi:MAG TPA: MSMEG_4193 family putative phosphomutase [Propionibacteriaceae bacterium]|nr:MSMEG_4193 family putative phosphomutase [Propionibacteriaceae bacterium]